MRRFRGAQPESIISHWISDERPDATIARALAEEGFLAVHEEDVDGETWWETTTKGNALAQTSFGRPITRKTAERHLAETVECALVYNADPSHLLDIAELVVFGSYLDPGVTSLGDLDLAVTFTDRLDEGSLGPDEQTEIVLRYAHASGRRFASFIDRLFWPRQEAVLLLRNRSTAINVTTEDVRDLTDAWQVVYRYPDVHPHPDQAGSPSPGRPDFAAQFVVCRCERDDCQQCEGWQLSPRMAAALWAACGGLAQDAADDIARHGDRPVVADDEWALFAEYPMLTWRQDAGWRRRAARAYDDLADDLAVGRWPRPRCPAEELALHLIIQELMIADEDRIIGGIDWDEFANFPADRRDRDWYGALDALFQDHDILNLYDADHDGIEDPSSQENQAAGMGDYRPVAWFTWFHNRTPRDPDRHTRWRGRSRCQPSVFWMSPVSRYSSSPVTSKGANPSFSHQLLACSCSAVTTTVLHAALRLTSTAVASR